MNLKKGDSTWEKEREKKIVLDNYAQLVAVLPAPWNNKP